MRRLCDECILIESGRVAEQGKTDTIINGYLKDQDTKIQTKYVLKTQEQGSDDIVVTAITIEDIDGQRSNNFPVGRGWQFRLFFEVKRKIEQMVVARGIVSSLHGPINTTWDEPRDYQPGHYSALFNEDTVYLTPGDYTLVIGISIRESGTLFRNVYYRESCGVVRIIDVAEDERLHDISTGLFVNQMNVCIEKQ